MRFMSVVLSLLIVCILSVNGWATCKVAADCDDGFFCNGVERCIISQSLSLSICAQGTPINCDDGVSCTIDSCSETQDMCIHDPGDFDGDGHSPLACGGDDCDDNDADRFPGNVEVCDSANHDEDCDPTTFGFKDYDADTFFDAACCNVQADRSLICGDDCDDSKSEVHPNQAEVCNGIDDNCKAGIDENLLVASYPDADHDGFGQVTLFTRKCPGEPGYSYAPNDCDDQDFAVHPGSMRCVSGSGNIQTCGKAGLWRVPVSCPAMQSCISQPNGTGLCLPQGADINGDGQIGLPEAINALNIASGQP